MWALRAPRIFDGEQVWTDGALILIDGATIVGMERRDAEAPEGCEVTEVSGTVLPGLIDAHIHLCGDAGPEALERLADFSELELREVITESLRRVLAAGVTTVRDLGDRRFAVLDWRASAPPGRWPRILAAGPPLTSVRGHCWNMGGEVTGEAELQAAVAERVERGVEVVKIMASGGFTTPGSSVVSCQFSDAELRLVVTESHRHGLPVTAHAHPLVAVDQVIRAGVDGIEHCSGFTDQGSGLPAATVVALRRESIAVCPTLGQTSLLHAPPAMLAMLAARGLTPELVMRLAAEQAARLLAAGVRLISGTDSGVGEAKPHGLLAVSLEALVQGGAEPTAALASATSVAAEVLGVGAAKGRIAADYDADLVLVDGDPTADIADLQRVRRVYVDGEVAWDQVRSG